MVPPRDRPPASVLLWKIGALGDVLMTTPLVRQLRAQLPGARIEYLVGRSCRVVLQGNPHIDRVLEFDERILHGAQLSRLGEVLALLRGYDVIYVLDKHWIFGWLARLARVPQRIGFRRRAVEGWPHTIAVPYGAVRHEIDCYLDLAAAAGIAVDRADRALHLPPAAPFDLPQPYAVAINSGGNNAGESSDVRKLPAPLFAQLVEMLAARTQVVFLGGPQEHADYQALALRHGARNLCGGTTLPQAWSVLAQAQAVYTTDTGLMHMAAACNHNVVAVFGPTHPARKCPPGAHAVWADADVYDPQYETYGRLPRGQYYGRVTADDILTAGP
jgi:ADP-heptose:LPS heptosyltransferase